MAASGHLRNRDWGEFDSNRARLTNPDRDLRLADQNRFARRAHKLLTVALAIVDQYLSAGTEHLRGIDMADEHRLELCTFQF